MNFFIFSLMSSEMDLSNKKVFNQSFCASGLDKSLSVFDAICSTFQFSSLKR